MNLINIFKNYIRGSDYGTYTEMPPGYTIESIHLESGINRDLSIIILFLFLAIFWLGMENYIDIVQYIIVFFRRKRN